MGDDGTRRKSGRPFHPYDAACVVISEWNDGVPVIRHSGAAIFPYNNLEIRKNRVNTHTHTHTQELARQYTSNSLIHNGLGVFLSSGEPRSQAKLIEVMPYLRLAGQGRRGISMFSGQCGAGPVHVRMLPGLFVPYEQQTNKQYAETEKIHTDDSACRAAVPSAPFGAG